MLIIIINSRTVNYFLHRLQITMNQIIIILWIFYKQKVKCSNPAPHWQNSIINPPSSPFPVTCLCLVLCISCLVRWLDFWQTLPPSLGLGSASCSFIRITPIKSSKQESASVVAVFNFQGQGKGVIYTLYTEPYQKDNPRDVNALR